MSITKLFKEAIRDIIRWTMNDDGQPVRDMSSMPIGINHSKYSSSGNIPATLNFSVTSATGGKVITVRHYDPRTDRTSENVYIITDKEDLAQELAQIITIENLQH